MTHRYLHICSALAIAIAWSIAPRLVHADAASDYDAKWASREKAAKTPAERAKLANDLYKAASGLISKSSKADKETIFDLQKDLRSLRGGQKEEVIFLCNKAYEIGSKQQDGYAPAAKALGILQALDPEQRLDSLTKLRKMYEHVYLSGSSKNLGIAKGYAAVNLQLADEQWDRLQEAQAKGKIPPAEYVTTIKSVSANYNKGLEVIRSAMNTIRPYAKGNKAYEAFLDSAGDVEKDLIRGQKSIAAPLAAAMDLDRTLRSITSFQARLTANASDTSAADRLVRLYLNEMDDPAAVETVVGKASTPVKDVVALLKKPVSKLTAAQAFAVAQWCEKSNDNPNSPNRIAMNVRTRVYCEAYQKAAKPTDADWKTIDNTLKRVSMDLAKAQVDDDKVRTMTAAYIEALEPPPVVAVAPVEPAPVPEKPVENPEQPNPLEKPEAVKPVEPPEPKPLPAPKLAKIKVEPAPAEPAPEPRRENNSTIFDFNQD